MGSSEPTRDSNPFLEIRGAAVAFARVACGVPEATAKQRTLVETETPPHWTTNQGALTSCITSFPSLAFLMKSSIREP